MTALLSIDESGNATTNALIHGLRDTESYGFSFAISVQRIASENLTLIAAKAQKATSTLIELLNKRETREAPWRYEETSYSLATLGIKDAAPLFQRDLKYERKNQSNYFFFFDRAIPESYESTCVRVSAAAALARLDPKNNEAVDYLLHVLEDDQWSVVAPSGAKGARLMDPRAIAATGLGLVGREARPALPALGRAMRKGREEQVDLSVKAAWAIARIDPVDRSCLSILKVAHFSNPTIS